MIKSIDSYVDNKMGENDRFDIVVSKDMGEEGNVDEIEFMEEVAGNEAKRDHSGNLDEYDLSLNIPIPLWKNTRSCMKHSICNYSYKNLLSQLQSFKHEMGSRATLVLLRIVQNPKIADKLVV